MKYTSKYILFILMALPMLMLQSCLHDDDEKFAKNSANRMEEYLDNARRVITSGNATWLMEMYPNSSQAYGGYAFTLKFSGDSVTAMSELFKSTEKESSLWTLTNDDGPVLTFDTYNSIIHFFSTPSGSSSAAGGYQAYQGEFGWIIADVQDDVIKLRGKKTGNTVYMYRMKEEPKTYIEGCQAFDKNIIFTGLRCVKGNDTINGIIDSDNRQISFTTSEGTTNVAYCVTPTGLRLYKDIEILGEKYRDFTVNYTAEGNVESLDANGEKFSATFPEGWLPFSAYAGDYTLYYYYGKNSAGEYCYETVDVSLVPNADTTKYCLMGLNPAYYVELSYKKTTGTLELGSQLVKDVNTGDLYKYTNGYYVGMISWDADKGYISYSNSVGSKIKWDGNEEGPMTFRFSDNGVWGTYKATSFTFYFFKATTLSTANRVSNTKDAKDLYVQGTYKSYQFRKPDYMVKK